MTQVLLTGCTGFVGSNLAKRLIEDGYNVYGLVRHSSRRDLRHLEDVLEKMHIIEGDFTEYHSACSAIAATNPQFVLHVGALTPVRLSFEDPFPFIPINFQGTVNLIHGMLEKAPRARLIYASTAEVYGWQEKKPIPETATFNPASPYAVSKAAADQYVQMSMRVYGLKATILRPINTYGRKGERGYFVEYLVTSMLKGDTVYVGAPDSVRDYMFVDDHVNAYIESMESEKAVGQAFNVSPGKPVTNKELTQLVAKLTDFEKKIMFGSYPPGYPQRPAQWDPDYLVLDSRKINKLLGWKPKVTLESGLLKTIECWKEESYSG